MKHAMLLSLDEDEQNKEVEHGAMLFALWSLSLNVSLTNMVVTKIIVQLSLHECCQHTGIKISVTFIFLLL